MTSQVRGSFGSATTLGATARARPASQAIRSLPGQGSPPRARRHIARAAPPSSTAGDRQADQFDRVDVAQDECAAGRHERHRRGPSIGSLRRAGRGAARRRRGAARPGWRSPLRRRPPRRATGRPPAPRRQRDRRDQDGEPSLRPRTRRCPRSIGASDAWRARASHEAERRDVRGADQQQQPCGAGCVVERSVDGHDRRGR